MSLSITKTPAALLTVPKETAPLGGTKRKLDRFLDDETAVLAIKTPNSESPNDSPVHQPVEKKSRSKASSNECSIGLIEIFNTSAATTIQAAFRGWRTRKAVVLPGQLVGALQRRLQDGPILDMARILCREINALSLDPAAVKKRVNVFWHDQLHEHHFPDFDADGNYNHKKTLSLSANHWIVLIEDQDANSKHPKSLKKSMGLMINSPANNSILGVGTYRRAYKAHYFEIPLSLTEGGGRNVECKNAVFKKHNAYDADENRRSDLEILAHNTAIQNGLHFHRTLAETFKDTPDVKLAASPIFSMPSNLADHSLNSWEYWYNGDLHFGH